MVRVQTIPFMPFFHSISLYLAYIQDDCMDLVRGGGEFFGRSHLVVILHNYFSNVCLCRSFEGSEELNQSDVVEDSSALPEAQDQQSNTVCDFNLPKAAREAEERNEDSSSEPANDDSMRDDGVPQEVQEEDEQDAPWSPHPAGLTSAEVLQLRNG